MKARLLLPILFTLIACGGGGKGGDEICNDSVRCIQPDPERIVESSALHGVYTILFELASNTCPNRKLIHELSDTFKGAEGVGYHGHPTLDLLSSSGDLYTGYSSVNNTDGRTFFSNIVGLSEIPLDDFLPGMTCKEQITLHLEGVSSNVATMRRDSSIKCNQNSETQNTNSDVVCEVTYTGSGSFISE